MNQGEGFYPVSHTYDKFYKLFITEIIPKKAALIAEISTCQ